MMQPVHPTIKISPTAWYYAPWRKLPPLPRPEIQPFDQQAACQWIDKLKKRTSYSFPWERLKLFPAMSRVEAHFWLLVMSHLASPWQETPEMAAARPFTRPVDGDISPSQVRDLILESKHWWGGNDQLIIPLANLLPLPDLMSLILEHIALWPQNIHVRGFQKYLMPYLTEDERALIRDLIRDQVAGTSISLTSYAPLHLSLYLAAGVGGFNDELEARISAIPDNHYRGPYMHGDVSVLFGLDDPARVEYHARRLGHLLFHDYHVEGWLAHTEIRALDWITASIIHAPRDTSRELFGVLAQVEDEAVVPHMLKLQGHGPVASSALAWLKQQHPKLAVRGAAALWATSGSANVREFLLGFKRRHEDAVLQSVQLDGDAQARFEAEILNYVDERPTPLTADSTPSWLAQAIDGATKGKKAVFPDWLDITELPPLLVDDHSLNVQQISALITALIKSRLDAPQPLIVALKRHVDAEMLDRFAWQLFQHWLDCGADSKDKWAMLAVGHFGGDSTALRLSPLLKKWPGEAQHQRAVTGLDCLRAIGTDTALMQINNIGQKAPFKGLKQAAQRAIEAIAAERHLTREELADRIVPDCGLDENGQRTFDFGPRRFNLVLSAELKPMIRDEDRKIKPDLPKPGARDDAALAQQSVKDWKLIKKQVQEVARGQAVRLEQAMIIGRRWPVTDFEMFLVRHPLMTHLAQRLVWAVYDSDGNLQTTFRVTAEHDYADADDKPLTLVESACVGIVHPLQLSADSLQAWGAILGDYDIIAPFAQLGRETHALEPGEAEAIELTRFGDIKIPSAALVGGLQKFGWNRGMVEDNGIYSEHSKPFPGVNVTAIVQYPGVPVGLMQWDDQNIEHCFFVSGLYAANAWYPRHENRLKLGEVDPIVISEVLRDLIQISSKGTPTQ